jgi:hypothetical protein
MPFIGTPTTLVSASIEAGARTPMFLVGGWSRGEDARTIDMGFAYAETAITAPRWDGTDTRALAAAWTNGGLPAVSFPQARACGQELASGEATTAIMLELVVAGDAKALARPLHVALHRAHVRMKIAADGKTATGIISGVLATEELTNAVDEIIGAIAIDACKERLREPVLDSVRQASDILADGSQDPNEDCNGISFGMGFEAVLATPGEIAAPVLPPIDPCNASHKIRTQPPP